MSLSTHTAPIKQTRLSFLPANGQNAVSAAGNSYPLDVLIFCTGFQTTQPLYSHLVHGRDGLSLADH
ncbi:hypothetical protein [Photorhabdus sp. SF281]|uniref:hypothetical protein n=1 Tax=Photorhabdus sp. SF281 TaxID=3459527 RepID=UPI0040443327